MFVWEYDIIIIIIVISFHHMFAILKGDRMKDRLNVRYDKWNNTFNEWIYLSNYAESVVWMIMKCF